MQQITASKHFSAPLETVWQVMADLESAAERVQAIVKLEVLTDGPVGLGTRFRETRIMFKKEATEEMEITVWNPPNSYTTEADGCGCHYTTVITCEADGDGTKVTTSMSIVPLTTFGKIMGAAIGTTEAALDTSIIDTVASPDKPRGAAAEEATKGAPITPTDAAKIVRVDEARISLGLDPIGGEDGMLSVAEYNAKREAQAVEAGKLIGQAEGQVEAQAATAEGGGAPPSPPEEG